MICVENLTKNFGKQALFDEIGFRVNARERVGVVGRNGHGKTTLFRLIAGLEESDAGSITMPRRYRIGYVRQELAFDAPTVREEAVRALHHDQADQVWRAEKILAGLGFGPRDLDKAPGQLSGGFQVRLNLAKILVGDYQMLLLDEPNNYLDIVSIRWLARFLQAWPGELMLITHDRGFMDQVVTHVLGIHRRKVRKVEGDTSKYYDQIAQEEEIYEKTRINDERKRKEMDLFITRFRAKARLAGLVQSRVKSLEKMEKRDKLETIKQLDFRFNRKPFHGKYAMTVDGLTFGYEPDRTLIKDFGLSIGSRDRVCVIGKNGRGKTTLIRLLAGDLKPLTGSLTSPLAVAPGYYEQSHVESLSATNTVLEEIASADAQMDPGLPRLIAGVMMFEGDDALKKISILSGGEKSRVLLGKLIASPLNLLLLDEPTNHLDLESSDALLAALDDFDGAVIMVTHNEMFLHALAERLIVFRDDGLTVFEGGYQRFLDKVGWEDEGTLRRGNGERGPSAAASGAPPEKLRRKELKRLRTDLLVERAKALKPLEKEVARLESAIQDTEAALNELNASAVEASRARAGRRVAELSKAIHAAKKKIDVLYAELETASSQLEKRRRDYDERIAELARADESAES
ncbi:MAG: ATP-binding cassette domain-containing protein [Candidatus Aminicenantes bacterium]|nr:ATP-binding cassette domain-containing protein [Candidatus Aminicenantes bacterium]